RWRVEKSGCKTNPAKTRGSGVVVFLVLFVVFIVIAEMVAVLAAAFTLVIVFLVVIIVIVEIFGDEIQMDRMSLRDFELGFTLGAAQDLAFFDFVFIDVDFSGTFGAADHVCILRGSERQVGAARIASTTVEQLLYTAVCDVNSNGRQAASRG